MTWPILTAIQGELRVAVDPRRNPAMEDQNGNGLVGCLDVSASHRFLAHPEPDRETDDFA